MPRTTRLIFTPACPAAYRPSIISGSMSEFILAQIAAGRFFIALLVSAAIRFNKVDFKERGDIEMFSKVLG